MKTLLNHSIALILCLFSSPVLQAQIRGIIQDGSGQAVIGATVLLQREADKSLVKGNVSASDGSFSFDKTAPGQYVVAVNYINYTPFQSGTIVLSPESMKHDLGIIRLQENSVQLGEVAVTARKQLFEQKIDRLVVNVSNAITAAGGNALEVLEKTPGVTVDRQNESISLAGKDGVQVMINGKLKYLPAASLLQILEGMNADNIEKIEIITTPPSNLDALGNAGYLNIVMKKQEDEGTTGSYSLSAGYGRGALASTSLNILHKKGKWNLYGEYGYNLNQRPQRFYFDRVVTTDGSSISLESDSDREPTSNNHNARMGFDYQLNKRTVTGMQFSGYNNRFVLDALGHSEFGRNGSVDTLLDLVTDLRSTWLHGAANAYVQHQIKDGEVISFDLDYLYYREENPTDYRAEYTDQISQSQTEESFRSGKRTPIQTAVAKTDYTRKWNQKLSMESGLKYVHSNFTNDLSVETLQNQNWIRDPDLSGIFELTEQIAAAYASFSYQHSSKTQFKLGLRYEHTLSNLASETDPDFINRNYGNFFPSFFVSRQLDASQSLNLSYSKRINRPTFNQMAPFVLFMDPFTFWSGNSALLPALTDNLGLSYRFKKWFLLVQYSYEKNSIARYQSRVDLKTNKMTMVSENLDYLKTLNASLNFPITLNKYWEMQNTAQINFQRALFPFEGEKVSVDQFNYSFNTTQRLNFAKGYSAEITGQYRSKQLNGQFISLPYYGVNLGIQKKLGKNGGILRFNVFDLFDSFVYRTENNLKSSGLVMNGSWDFIQRTYRLTYTQNFGSQKVKTKKRAEAEEKRRVNAEE